MASGGRWEEGGDTCRVIGCSKLGFRVQRECGGALVLPILSGGRSRVSYGGGRGAGLGV